MPRMICSACRGSLTSVSREGKRVFLCTTCGASFDTLPKVSEYDVNRHKRTSRFNQKEDN